MKYEIKELFKEFYTNPFIKSIENNKRWSISDNNKMPVNMSALKLNKIYGASFKVPEHMETLNGTLDIIPYPKNHAYYMDIHKDDFILLDIEPECPEEIKKEFLKTPYIYGEYSLSGKGVHLIYKKPKNWKDYDVILKKANVKEKNSFYEIMFSHWVTFTRNTLDIIDNSKNNDNDFFEKTFTKLCEEHKDVKVVKMDFEIQKEQKDKIKNFDYIVNSILSTITYQKRPEDFYDDKRGKNDMSKYEFGVTGFYYIRLKRFLDSYDIKYSNYEYSLEDKALLLYGITKKFLKFRPKHNEKRENLPWLLHLAKRVIQYDESYKEKS